MSRFFSFNPPINLLKTFKKCLSSNLECRHRDSQITEYIALLTIKDLCNMET